MFTAAAPRFVSVTVTICFPPTRTLPKSLLSGLKLNCPTADVPVPDSETLASESEAVLAMERVALKVPVAFGWKATLIGALWLGAMVMGRVGALREKYLVEIATLVRVMEADPEFVTVVETV